jgi:hypothetical protein
MGATKEQKAGIAADIATMVANAEKVNREKALEVLCSFAYQMLLASGEPVLRDLIVALDNAASGFPVSEWGAER